jgi:hypothetical protein
VAAGIFWLRPAKRRSYAQKWEYVRENPVRAGLVAEWHEFPYQGEIALIDRA